MKKLLVFLFACVSPTLFSQQINTITIERWEANDWENNILQTYSYNSNDQIASILGEFWEGTQYENSSLTSYSNYMGNTVGETISQIWAGTDWDNSTRTVNQVNGDGLLSESELTSWFNNMWNNFVFREYTYDTNEHLVYLLQEFWENGAYVNNSQVNYTNNADGFPIQLIGDSWNSDNNTWENSYRTTNTYNSDNAILEFLNETWNGSQYVNSSRNLYTYDGNGYLIELLTQIWDETGNSWVNSSFLTYQNNSNGTINTIITQLWTQSNTWENSMRWTYSYNTLSTEENEWNQLRLFPVPANDNLYLSHTSKNYHYTVYSLQGETIRSGYLMPGNAINLEGIASGTYLVSLTSEGQESIKKIIKQ
ncbi:T9SS type A sorting domain-containing protein [Aureisphaera galaxeae]|uniref:T9SS type A sorting domain-containing protein n=1 Tax=Aureisphaera galaxeae TaxID=1538023 RepID=UPI00235012E8|nr:T9SS type A sorting domain-containing protein [Aureisphaera galaxeae]MDC8003257.1 T9SS type A sorting domain-containing protein [Aureisphaera galaxeae]